jgi:hypothetical protein
VVTETQAGMPVLLDVSPSWLPAGTVANMHDFNGVAYKVIVHFVDVRRVTVKKPPHNIGFRAELRRYWAAFG